MTSMTSTISTISTASTTSMISTPGGNTEGIAMQQFATFHVGELYLGVPAVRVQEVLCSHQMTAIPLANPAIRGLINLRGQIVTAIDPRNALNLQPVSPETPQMNVVIQTEDGAVSLLVDEIGDVLEISLDCFTPVPDTLEKQNGASIVGVYRLERDLLLALDVERLLENACQLSAA